MNNSTSLLYPMARMVSELYNVPFKGLARSNERCFCLALENNIHGVIDQGFAKFAEIAFKAEASSEVKDEDIYQAARTAILDCLIQLKEGR
jgi:hypothetical protein